MLIYVENWIFSLCENNFDKFRPLACIQYENRNAVAYDCRDVAIILRQPKFKKSQSTHSFHNERNRFSNRWFFLEAKVKTKSNHEVVGSSNVHFVYMTSLIFDVIGRLYPKDQE